MPAVSFKENQWRRNPKIVARVSELKFGDLYKGSNLKLSFSMSPSQVRKRIQSQSNPVQSNHNCSWTQVMYRPS